MKIKQKNEYFRYLVEFFEILECSFSLMLFRTHVATTDNSPPPSKKAFRRKLKHFHSNPDQKQVFEQI